MKALLILATIASLTGVAASCSSQNNKDASQAQTQSQKPAIAVDVAIATLESLEGENEYTGTTAPIREVGIRMKWR